MAKKDQSQDPQPDEPKDIRAMVASTVGVDLLQALLTEIKLLPKPWVSLPKAKQDDVIERLRARVDTNVKMAVHLIASQGRTVVEGDLDQITIKDGAKAVIKIGRGAESLHELYEAQGKAVMVVVSDAAAHTGGMDEVHGESDQRAMDLGREYTDQDGDGMDDHKGDSNVVDVEATAIEQQPLQAEFDEAEAAGYEAAGAGLDQDACPVMDRRLCIAWIKGWKAWHEKHDEQADHPSEALE